MDVKWNTLVEVMDESNTPFFNDVLAYLDTKNISTVGSTYGCVDLSKVVGTTHSNYCEKTWGELKPVVGTSRGDIINDTNVVYQNLKRAVGNVKDLERNPDYYFSQEEKDHWSFYEIDGEYYIAEGNNRTVIGRFFLTLNHQTPVVHGVRIMQATYSTKTVAEQKKKGVVSSVFSWLKNAVIR